VSKQLTTVFPTMTESYQLQFHTPTASTFAKAMCKYCGTVLLWNTNPYLHDS